MLSIPQHGRPAASSLAAKPRAALTVGLDSARVQAAHWTSIDAIPTGDLLLHGMAQIA